MKYYKDINGSVFAYELDGSQDHLIGDKVTMSGRMGRKIASGKAGCCLWRGLVCAVLSLIDFRTWKDTSNHCLNSHNGEV